MQIPVRDEGDPLLNPKQRKKRRKRKFRVRFLLLCLGLSFLMLGISAFGYASWRFERVLDNMTSPTSVKPQRNSVHASAPIDVKPEEEKPRSLSLLILGRDYRPETGTNLTDVMIVVGLDLDNKSVNMVSVPRDTKVSIPGLKYQVKANEALSIGENMRRQQERSDKRPTVDGPQMAKHTASQLFDIPIDNYVTIDFKSFQAIVDEVGGIEVHVERDMIYHDPTDNTNINLKAGSQRLSGKKALDWVRHRQDDRGPAYYSSDFDRNKRQKEAIKAIASKLATVDGMTKIFNVMDVMSNHIQTDLTKDQIKELIWDFKTFQPDAIVTLETPNVYWDSVNLGTVIPEEDVDYVHQELEKVLNNAKKN